MLDHVKEALDMIKGLDRESIDKDRKLNLALVRLLEIVGEAAGRVSKETQEKNRMIPWFEIISFRNRLIHGYDAVDLDILWAILKEDLPELVKKLKEIISDQ
ncbi:DUF86 domain-containing protein [bacterium]|nr:DUF86 domain-containing protein [bacterium]